MLASDEGSVTLCVEELNFFCLQNLLDNLKMHLIDLGDSFPPDTIRAKYINLVWLFVLRFKIGFFGYEETRSYFSISKISKRRFILVLVTGSCWHYSFNITQPYPSDVSDLLQRTGGMLQRDKRPLIST